MHQEPDNLCASSPNAKRSSQPARHESTASPRASGSTVFVRSVSTLTADIGERVNTSKKTSGRLENGTERSPASLTLGH